MDEMELGMLYDGYYWDYYSDTLSLYLSLKVVLTHWGRVTHIWVGKLTVIGSDNGLLPGRRQAIFWTNAVILLIGPMGTNFSEILTKIYAFSFRKMHLEMSSAKWRWGGWCCEVSCGGHHRQRGKTTIPCGQLWMEQCLTSFKYWPI